MTMPTTSDYVDRVRRVLAGTEPELDTSVGSVVRKISDAYAQVLATATADQKMLSYLFDLNSKSGSDLDDFALNFSIVRLAP